MKSFIQQEGLNYSSDHRFGNPDDHLPEFHFIVSYSVEHYLAGDLDYSFSYALTEDGYIQVCCASYARTHSVIAQFLRNGDSVKSQILSILRMYFTDGRYYDAGFPEKYTDGAIFTREEFESFLEEMEAGFRSNKAMAQENPPEMVKMCKARDLDPEPDGRDVFTWLCTCPRCHRSLLTFSAGSESWRCRYCKLSGNSQRDLVRLINSIRNKKASDERRKAARNNGNGK